MMAVIVSGLMDATIVVAVQYTMYKYVVYKMTMTAAGQSGSIFCH